MIKLDLRFFFFEKIENAIMVFLCLDVGFRYAKGYISLLNFPVIQYLFFSI